MTAVVVLLAATGILGGIAIAVYVGGYLMLYQGICQAIVAEGAAKVWPIMKAVFCEFGITPGLLFGALMVSIALAVERGRR